MTALCRACRHHQFLVPARRFASAGNGGERRMRSALPPSASPTATALPASCAPMSEWKKAQGRASSWSARASSRSDGFEVLAYPTDRAAYGRLCRLLTEGNLKAKKGECHLTFEDILAASEGQISSRCRRTELSTGFHRAACRARAAPRRSAASSPASIAIAATSRAASACSPSSANARARRSSPSTTCIYHVPERRPLADVLTCIREKCTIAEAGFRLARQCRAASQAARGDGAAVRRLSRSDRAHDRDRRGLPLLARRTQIRISRRAGAARQDRAAASRRPDLGGRAQALSQGLYPQRHSRQSQEDASTRSSRSSPGSTMRAIS